MLKQASIVTGLVCALVGYSMAENKATNQQTQYQQQTQQQQIQQRQGGAQFVRTDQLVGADVENNNGEDLGSITDIVLSPDHKTVSYVVLTHGGTLGMGGERFAVPWQGLQFQYEDDGDLEKVILDIPENRFEQAQGFDRDNWPQTADNRWLPASAQQQQSGTMQQQQQQRGQTDRKVMEYRKVSELTGLTVRNQQDRDLGNIENLIIDSRMGQGHVAFAVISYGGVLGIGENLSAVPFSALEIRPQNDMAMLNATRQQLDQTAFSSDQYPNFGDRQYAQNIHRQYNQEPYWEVFGFGGAQQQDGMQQQPQQPQQRRQQQQQQDPQFRAWQKDSQYGKNWKQDSMTTVRGTVQSIGTFKPEPQAAPGLRLRVLTQQGNTVTVHAGPAAYAQSKNIQFGCGDRLTITGSQTDFNGQSIVMASQIRKNGQTLMVRDRQGNPQWDVQQLQQSGQR